MLNFRWEKRLAKKTGKVIVGIDEAGRGPIAGPIAVGAVLIDFDFYKKIKPEDNWWQWVNDSKKLSPALREEIFVFIERYMVFGVGMASSSFIDKHGIKKATEIAARKAIKKLGIKPAVILVDGNRKLLNHRGYSERTVVRGDGLVWSIACASIAAKVTRDRYMKNAHKKWPQYKFALHKGYGTALHLECLTKHGPCPLHRFSFAPLKNRGFQKSFSRLKRGSEES